MDQSAEPGWRGRAQDQTWDPKPDLAYGDLIEPGSTRVLGSPWSEDQKTLQSTAEQGSRTEISVDEGPT